jgi:hypothetical protein
MILVGGETKRKSLSFASLINWLFYLPQTSGKPGWQDYFMILVGGETKRKSLSFASLIHWLFYLPQTSGKPEFVSNKKARH